MGPVRPSRRGRATGAQGLGDRLVVFHQKYAHGTTLVLES
ncbi:hypothetical protein STRIP9103_07482 [Streptomyces ipomoeae 91-03]|uniref:Uncharacterized protein n=1 Tax=Streptomyces ipomoeae 91-03 TaxID=698759 RepID=L1L694_9ACTN|nr:hypothetical protein STRIP9103_07482 [Streptomyces ipomoeae 91-03]